MENIEKEIEKVSQKILKSYPDIKQKISPEPYHFIELCIIFIEYCDDLTISKEDFLAANKIFFDEEDSEDMANSKEEFFSKIYNLVWGKDDPIPVYILFGYLKIISINEKINNEILFKILDRKEKGNIDFENIETLITNLEEFLDMKEEWDDFIESFKGKKLIMRNLSQGDFTSKIKKLFELAEIKIYDIANKSYEAYIEKYKENNDDDISEKNDDINNKDNSLKSSSNISSSKLVSRKSLNPEKNQEEQNKNNINMDENKEENEQNKQAMVPYDSSHNINNNNSNGINLEESNFDESLFEKIFDRRKEIKIHQIKNSSLLYDIDLYEFLYEFKKYEKNKIFDKNKFISIFIEIIQSHTSDVFKGPLLRYSLSLLYQIIDIEKKNKLSYYEILGPIIVLTKAKTEERLNIIFSYKPPELISIICGILSLYLNSDIIKDFSILSEIFIKTWYQLDIKKSKNFLEWIFGNKNEEVNLDKDFDFLIEEDKKEDIDNIYDNNMKKIITKINNIFLDKNFSLNNDFNIIDITNKIMLKYSLIGQINLNQIYLLIDDLLNIKFGEQNEKEKIKAKEEFINFIDKYINFTKNELIDITHLHALFILIFPGSTLDKVRSIFIIHDLNETENMKKTDFEIYLKRMFNFMLKKIDFGVNILENDLSKNIVENFNKGKESISFGELIEFFDNLNNDIPE